MRDLQLSFVSGANGKHIVATTVEFDKAGEALLFNEKLVELLKSTIEDHLAEQPAVMPSDGEQAQDDKNA